MKQYPIWHEVQACHYKSKKSYGGMNNSIDTIRVGSSAYNSHELATVATTRRFYTHERYGAICEFRLTVDSIVVKRMLFEDNNGKAGKLLRTYKMRSKGWTAQCKK